MSRNLERLDRKVLWHPFTQQREWDIEPPDVSFVIARGQGNYLYDARGRKYLDGVSSLWANLHGHRRPELDRAIEHQLKRVAHSTFLGLTHEPGIKLAEALVNVAPKGLSRVFYSDNGSTAVEVALKMAFQSHAQRGEKGRTEFLALQNSYHGDTLGSVSVGGIGLFHAKFKPLLFKTHFALSPHCLRCPYNKKKEPALQVYEYKGEQPKPGDHRSQTGCRWECLGSVDSILRKRGKRIAAAVVEPVVQGASGILVQPPGYLKGVERLCRKYGVLLIADEVATGFGRTGKMFAAQHENVRPDLMCLAKGISGGYLPLAATLATERIYQSFLGRYDQFKTFFHGHTYTANPLACAAGLASMVLLQKKGMETQTRLKAKALTGFLKELLALKHVGHVRQAGLMAGVELVRDKRSLKSFPPGDRVGKKVCMAARAHGLLLRPLGDVVVMMPPLSIEERELKNLTSGVGRAIRAVTEAA